MLKAKLIIFLSIFLCFVGCGVTSRISPLTGPIIENIENKNRCVFKAADIIFVKLSKEDLHNICNSFIKNKKYNFNSYAYIHAGNIHFMNNKLILKKGEEGVKKVINMITDRPASLQEEIFMLFQSHGSGKDALKYFLTPIPLIAEGTVIGIEKQEDCLIIYTVKGGRCGTIKQDNAEEELKSFKEKLLEKINSSQLSDLNNDITQKFYSAASLGKLERLKSIIAQGIDVNIKNKIGITPLMMASENGNPSIIRELLANKADVNKRAANGGTAIMNAAEKGNISALKLLIEHGGNLNNSNEIGLNSLMIAARRGHIMVVKELLDRGVDINAKTANGVTALMLASNGGYPDVVQLLLDKGADYNVKTIDGETAINVAKKNGFNEIVLILEKAGAKYP